MSDTDEDKTIHVNKAWEERRERADAFRAGETVEVRTLAAFEELAGMPGDALDWRVDVVPTGTRLTIGEPQGKRVRIYFDYQGQAVHAEKVEPFDIDAFDVSKQGIVLKKDGEGIG